MHLQDKPSSLPICLPLPYRICQLPTVAGSEILLLEAAWDLYEPKREEGDCVSSSMILEHLDAWQGQCLVLTIVVILAIEWLGRNLSLWLVMKAFGTKTARFYDTRITAIGVIHHELSHLLVAIFTGARIDGVKLYKIFQKQDDEVLGYVNYTPRGLYPFRCIQQTLIGIAPGILGMVQICTMSQLLLGFWSSLGNDCFKHPAIWILAIVMSQIAYHSCPSRYDIQGSWFCIGLVVLAFCLFRDNIFPTWFALQVIQCVAFAVILASAPVMLLSVIVMVAKLIKHLVFAGGKQIFEVR